MRSNIAAMAAYTPGEQPRDGEYIKLNTNENPYPPSPQVIEAIQRVLTGEKLRKYPDPLGTEFREAAGGILGVDPEAILIGNGSDDVLTIITRTLVPEGGLIVSPSPSYLLYRTLADIQGARYRTIPFDGNWQLDATKAIPEADVTYVANPNSPTGTAVSADVLSRWPGYLVVDEAYVDFAEMNCLDLAKKSEAIIVTRSMSKSYSLAGIRFGFAVAAPEIVRHFYKVKDSYNCDTLSLAAATAAIRDQKHMLANRAKVIETRNRLSRELRQLGFRVLESQANFLWAQRGDGSEREIYGELKRRKILVRYMNYEGYGEGLRISVGTDGEADRLVGELKTM